MRTGIRYRANPTRDQAQVLSRRMGCARVIWNAKCEEDRYLRKFAAWCMPVGTYPPVDKTYSQYKTDMTPWLNSCPSQILRNNAKAKSGLNRALLGTGLYRFEEFLTYKAEREGKPVFKVSPINTSRECAACGYTHADNRRTQSEFRCQRCGHTDNADRNAARVIRKRAIHLILHPGTGLSGRRGNVLTPAGADAKPCRTREAKATRAAACPSKKKAAWPLEARTL